MFKVIEIMDSDEDTVQPGKVSKNDGSTEQQAQASDAFAAEKPSTSATTQRQRNRRKSAHVCKNSDPEFETVVIRSNPSSVTDLVTEVSTKYVNSNEAKDLINQIAEERVRINYLLSTCDVDTIAFKMGSNAEHLKFQFEQRMKKRKSKLQQEKQT